MRDSKTNKDLNRYLFETYYQAVESSPDDEFVSVHWMEQRQILQASDDESNGPMPSGNFNWGCKWNGLSRRIFDPIETLSHLMFLPNKLRLLGLSATAAKVCKRMGLDLTFTVFRQVCSLELLQRNLPAELNSPHINILVIGDGIGVLSALLKAVFPMSTIVMVDIGKTLFYQAYHVQKAYPQGRHKLASDAPHPEDPDFAYCPTERLDDLENYRFDIAINIASMQEMTPETIERYFRFLRSNLNESNLFYCFNREHKTLGSGVETAFLDYPWQEDDLYLVDEYCPWPSFFIGRQQTPNRPRLLGIGIPYVKYYDGRFRHRLAVLKTSD